MQFWVERGGQLLSSRYPLHYLFLEHGFPYSSAGVGKPVLELLLVDSRLLHEHGLILWSRVRMRKMFWREQPERKTGKIAPTKQRASELLNHLPSLESVHGACRQLSARLAAALSGSEIVRAIVIIIIGHGQLVFVVQVTVRIPYA